MYFVGHFPCSAYFGAGLRTMCLHARSPFAARTPQSWKLHLRDSCLRFIFGS